MTDSENLRIGTAEREHAVKLLSDHMSEGRLSVPEYEERIAGALEALTRADLRTLFSDLPPPYPPFMTPVQALPTAPPAMYSSAPALATAEQSDRSRVAAGVLQIVLPFGVGRFYTGHAGIGVAQLLTAFIGVGVVWSMIDGIIMLASGGKDAYGRELRL